MRGCIRARAWVRVRVGAWAKEIVFKDRQTDRQTDRDRHTHTHKEAGTARGACRSSLSAELQVCDFDNSFYRVLQRYFIYSLNREPVFHFSR